MGRKLSFDPLSLCETQDCSTFPTELLALVHSSDKKRLLRVCRIDSQTHNTSQGDNLYMWDYCTLRLGRP